MIKTIKTIELLLGLKILSVTIILYVKKHEPLCMLVALLCLTLPDPMDCSLQGSSIHGIFQIRILEWVSISFSRGIFLTQGLNPHLHVSCTASGFFITESPGKPYMNFKRTRFNLKYCKL